MLTTSHRRKGDEITDSSLSTLPSHLDNFPRKSKKRFQNGLGGCGESVLSLRNVLGMVHLRYNLEGVKSAKPGTLLSAYLRVLLREGVCRHWKKVAARAKYSHETLDRSSFEG
eukprot:g30299.t1